MNLTYSLAPSLAPIPPIQEILGNILVPENVQLPAYEQFPPLNRRYQGPDWWDTSKRILMLPKETRKYEVLYDISNTVRPYLIAAFGVGIGYDVMSLAKGAVAAGISNVTINGYDDTGDGRLDWIRQACISDRIPYNLSHSNARQYDACGIPLRHIDLFYLSDIANQKDLAKDLNLVLPTLSPKGIIVTDYDNIGFCDEFAATHGFKLTSMAVSPTQTIRVLDR